MPDIVIQKPEPANVTVASSTTQVVVQQQPANVVVLQTSGSYVLQPATANTIGGVKVGNNLTIDGNGVLSATAGTVTSFPWSNITGTPTTLGGYNITDAVTTLANVTHGNTTLPNSPGVNSVNRRPFVGDYGTSGNSTIYAGFQTSNGTPSVYLGGGATRIGNDILFAELQASPFGVSLKSNRYTVNSSNQTTAIAYQYQFGINGDTFQAILFNTVGGQVYNAGLVVTPTGSYFDAGAFGSLDLTGDDVTVQTNQVEPGPLSVLNRMMADQLYQQVVRKN